MARPPKKNKAPSRRSARGQKRESVSPSPMPPSPVCERTQRRLAREKKRGSPSPEPAVAGKAGVAGKATVPPRKASVPPRQAAVPPRQAAVPPRKPTVPPRKPKVPGKPTLQPAEPILEPAEPTEPILVPAEPAETTPQPAEPEVPVDTPVDMPEIKVEEDSFICQPLHSFPPNPRHRTSDRPVKESIREVDVGPYAEADSWIIGDRLLLRRGRSPSAGTSWKDGAGGFYTLSEAPFPLPATRRLSLTSHIERQWDASGRGIVWLVGEAVCKVKMLDDDATREHRTVHYLRGKKKLSFAVPDTYYHGEHDGRYYIILSRPRGKTLGEAWPSLDEAAKEHCVSRVVEICKEVSVWRAECISGVDGRDLLDLDLARRKRVAQCNPVTLESNCKAMRMDCSAFVFYHCDLAPCNLMLLAGGTLAIIDWETAGFVPRDWIRTKFRVSSGLNMPGFDHDSRVDWRRRVEGAMRKEGFRDLSERWVLWRR